MARGHDVSAVPEVPLVISSGGFTDVKKTQKALALLKAVGAAPDLERVKNSRKTRKLL